MWTRLEVSRLTALNPVSVGAYRFSRCLSLMVAGWQLRSTSRYGHTAAPIHMPPSSIATVTDAEIPKRRQPLDGQTDCPGPSNSRPQ
jgi:hypothetical protein